MLHLSCRFSQMAGSDGDVDLATDDGFDARFGARLVVSDGTKQVAVVGDGQGRHFILTGQFGHGADGAAAIQQAVFAVAVQVNELGSCHGVVPRQGKEKQIAREVTGSDQGGRTGERALRRYRTRGPGPRKH